MVNEVRDRSREILRAELADAAATFCAEHGFDEVTANEIAHGIGVSRATFFRYFASKEDAVVSAARGAAARGAFAQRIAQTADAAEPGTTVWAIIRGAAESMIDMADTRGDALRARIRMITDVPALRAYLASATTAPPVPSPPPGSPPPTSPGKSGPEHPTRSCAPCSTPTSRRSARSRRRSSADPQFGHGVQRRRLPALRHHDEHGPSGPGFE